MRSLAAQVHREINEMQPIVDARLADGSRVNGVYKNVAVNGPILTIRKFSDRYRTLESLIAGETISEEGGRLLALLVACGYNLFISGGTSSGKTTFLNALADYIPEEERIIVIEDSSELKLAGIKNIVHLECRNRNTLGKGEVNMAQLIKSSLRMRPDRIIVGEVRGGEVLDMLQAMNTGHAGSMSTGHGNSVEGMLHRLETMYMMAMPLHVDAIRAQIAEAIDVMIHLEKSADGRRRVVEIVEVIGYSQGTFRLNPLMTMSADWQRLEPTGNTIKSTRKLILKGDGYAGQLRDMGFIP
jgi:pilus assembly protein CpaF